MSALRPSESRMLAFELGSTLFALPISGVVEVAEVARIAPVPMLPRASFGVVNHHGDALPVVFGGALLEFAGESAPTRLLVLAGDADDPERYGLPVDRILGLVAGDAAPSRSDDAVAERRPHEGRVLNVLDPRRLLTSARALVEGSLSGDRPQGEMQ
jgi:chemotaxis signal transduction protein